SESAALSEQLGDREGLAVALGWDAPAQPYLGDDPTDERLAEQGLALSEALGEPVFAAFHGSMLALLGEKDDDEARANAHWEEVRRLVRTFDDHPGAGTHALWHLAAVAFARGELAPPRPLRDQYRTLARQACSASSAHPSPP